MTQDERQSQAIPARHQKVRKAVLPAAGLGTRFLPATKAQPKEMLAVVDKPQIQYVAEECVASGIEHIIIVTGKGKNSIEDHFDSAPVLEQYLEQKGKHALAELVRRISNMVQVSYTRQKEPLGLGHAVLVAKDLVGDEPFAVLLGDVLIPGKNPATKQLIDVYEATGTGAIAVEEVPREKTHLYGIVDGEPAPIAPLANAYCAFAISSKSPQPKKRPRISPSPGVTFSLPPSSIASNAPSPVPAAKSSSPTACASSPKSKACGLIFTKEFPTMRATNSVS